MTGNRLSVLRIDRRRFDARDFAYHYQKLELWLEKTTTLKVNVGFS
jgi:hypothetical protein